MSKLRKTIRSYRIFIKYKFGIVESFKLSNKSNLYKELGDVIERMATNENTIDVALLEELFK